MTKQFKTLKERMLVKSRDRSLKRTEELLAEERAASSKCLVDKIDASFITAQDRARAIEGEDALATSDEDLESLITAVIRRSRCGVRNSSKRKAPRR